MKVSYNWIKQYLNVDLAPERVSELLTDSGLEIEGMETFQSLEGGLAGIVIGEVMTKEKHPGADKLNLTTVNVGGEELLNIVCGATNLDKGQKVVVATVGATLYPIEGEAFKIKKSKIRGEESFGMICAEDEIGLGKGHEGIMVLDASVAAGTKASDYFSIENDIVFEIGLTPNRSDAMGHFGVARDLAAVLNSHKMQETTLTLPSVAGFAKDNDALIIDVAVEDNVACPRYTGVTLTEVAVAESPEWLKNRIKAIGLGPINNVVDVTNYVMHELGQPLHAFDAAVVGSKVIVKQLPEGTKFTTLDEKERKLSDKDLMICNDKAGMCIAGVFGGLDSGVSNKTTSIFLESAYFNPVSVRKTAKRHAVNTDSSFRFERGVDPELTVVALKRAALLIKEIAGGKISSDITDIYPTKIAGFNVEFDLNYCDRLIGKSLDRDLIKTILASLDIELKAENGDVWSLYVPPYRTDVQRAVDVVEEILRIYGYNNIESPAKLNTSLSYGVKPDKNKLQNSISDMLTSNGFSEIMNNSLTANANYDNNQVVKMLNPLSAELDVMRQDLLTGALTTVAYNLNRKAEVVKLYEFGRSYFKLEEGYQENELLCLVLAGKKATEQWNSDSSSQDFHNLKAAVDAIISKIGVSPTRLKVDDADNASLSYGLSYYVNGKTLLYMGEVDRKMAKGFEVDQTTYYAEINWGLLVDLAAQTKIKFTPVSKFPEVRRDLSLLLANSVSYGELKEAALKADRKLLKAVNVFDVYQGKNLPEGKKSYALSFTLQDENKTLSDKEIDKVMKKIQQTFEQQFNAELR
jgi:phenylalanyl-tRNA synthetase beta chain